MNSALAAAALAVHLIWILFVIFGAAITRNRPALAILHIVSLLWGVVVELSPLPCPLTLGEQFFEQRAGIDPYRGGFLLHYLDRIVYPALPDWLLTVLGVLVCSVNLGIYFRRYHRNWKR
ncbi:MAG TPA: DUF2784 domain-containing protein [Bryobacteraceae bacterium]|nr:DUF2784 domain-containing protein [Bryobacteraceae bacterium]